VILRGVMFQTGKSALKPDRSRSSNRRKSLNANPDIRIEIAGYTDNHGSAAHQPQVVAGAGRCGARIPREQGLAPGRMGGEGVPSWSVTPSWSESLDGVTQV